MEISVILAHTDKNSFNHTIAATTVETLKQSRHEVYFRDLYEEKFDPISPTEEIQKDTPLLPIIEKHCNEISKVKGR